MAVEIQINVEDRGNNIVFFCAMDGEYYNYKNTKPYSVGNLNGINLMPDGRAMINFGKILICENCWKNNVGNKSADSLDFEEPSKIIKANGPLPKRIIK